MEKVKVVIGKNFGDEGKGAAVHRLCQEGQTIVVRHNGGAQAGHTVEDGSFRFVFHQLGSGSRAGCHTYWSHTFLPDLLKLGEEMEAFTTQNSQTGAPFFQPIIYAHPNCACTVIYDVLLNSLKETLRRNAKHGSCGMGIYEATVRVQKEVYTLRLKDFVDAKAEDIGRRMWQIRENYTYPALQGLHEEFKEEFLHGNPEIQQWVELIEDDNLLWNAAEQMCENFHRFVILKDWQEIKKSFKTVIFENAQGLMLDRDNMEYYPHLTPSYTGLTNVIELLQGDPIGKKSETTADFTQGIFGELEIIYVTRTYVTRHGIGRLDNECTKDAINPRMVDKTNVPNMWQDCLRYGKHPQGEAFWKYIDKDLSILEKGQYAQKPKLIVYVNHLDETDGKVLFENKAMEFDEFQKFCLEKGFEARR